MSQTIDLTLDGLSCGHCVKRVKESLEQRPDVEQADVSITEAHVTGTASAEQLIETIKQAGYDASVSHPKAKPLAESSIPSEALTAVSEALPAATADDDDSQQLLLSGMSCASCAHPRTKCVAKRTGRHSGTGKPGGAYCAGDGQCLPTRFSAGGGKSGLRRGSD